MIEAVLAKISGFDLNGSATQYLLRVTARTFCLSWRIYLVYRRQYTLCDLAGCFGLPAWKLTMLNQRDAIIDEADIRSRLGDGCTVDVPSKLIDDRSLFVPISGASYQVRVLLPMSWLSWLRH